MLVLLLPCVISNIHCSCLYLVTGGFVDAKMLEKMLAAQYTGRLFPDQMKQGTTAVEIHIH